MNNMIKELFDEQKEDLFNLVKEGCSDSDIRDYCAENNISYKLAQDFIDETYEYLDNNVKMNEIGILKEKRSRIYDRNIIKNNHVSLNW